MVHARFPERPRIHAQFVEKPGHFYVCPICFNERDLDEADRSRTPSFEGATPLMALADGAMTFSY